MIRRQPSHSISEDASAQRKKVLDELRAGRVVPERSVRDQQVGRPARSALSRMSGHSPVREPRNALPAQPERWPFLRRCCHPESGRGAASCVTRREKGERQRHDEQGEPNRYLTVDMKDDPHPRVASSKQNGAADRHEKSDGCRHSDRWRPV